MAAVLQGRVHGAHGFFPPDEQGQDHIIKDDHIAHGQHGQHVGHGLGGRAAFVFAGFGRGGLMLRLRVRVGRGAGFAGRQSGFFVKIAHILLPDCRHMRCACVML